MRIVALILFCLLFERLSGQTVKSVLVVADGTSSTYFNLDYKKSVDSAFIIASEILSSQELHFRLANLKFPSWNRCKTGKCEPTKKFNAKDSILGSQVIGHIFSEDTVVLVIYFEEKSKSSLGSTCPGQYSTTAYFKNIITDMDDIPWGYAIAANLCHEYMHHVGFCHWTNAFYEPDRNTPDPSGFSKDIAYRIGWESYYIARAWFLEGRKISGL